MSATVVPMSATVENLFGADRIAALKAACETAEAKAAFAAGAVIVLPSLDGRGWIEAETNGGGVVCYRSVIGERDNERG